MAAAAMARAKPQPMPNALRSLGGAFTRFVLEPFFRLIGGKSRIWPPSRTSAPALCAIWALMMAFLLKHMREKKHRAIDDVQGRRRRLALETLDSILKNEEERTAGAEDEEAERVTAEAAAEAERATAEAAEKAAEEAAAALIAEDATVFLGTGTQNLGAFANLRARRIICRRIDPPRDPFPFPGGEYLVGRPPFSVEDEIALFRKLSVDWLVVKNSGGAPSRTKLDAARALGIRVALINRPALPEAMVFQTVEAALSWVRGLL